MGASYTRRFTFDPGATVLLAIESINVLDLEPPSPIQGVGSGAVLATGEFEDGPYVPTEVSSGSDFSNIFGTLGYSYFGVPANYPCAVSRSADSAITPEFWNGSGFVQLNGKKFARLLVCRVNTSVGAVQFARLAYVTGSGGFSFPLNNGDVIGLDVGAGPQTASISATAATVTGSGGTYPTTFAGGQTLTLAFDGQPSFTTTFLAADQSAAQVAARINTYAGFTFADTSGGQLRLTGRQKGSGASVTVVSGSSGVLTQLGLTAATTAGTGNVANVAAVAPLEIKAIVELAISGTHVETDPSGFLRFSATANPYVLVTSATTAALGLVTGQEGTSNGQAVLVSGSGTYVTGFGGTETLTLNVDGAAQNTVVAFQAGDQSLAQVVSRINTALGATVAVADSTTRFYLQGTKVGGSVQVVGASGAGVLTTLGLVVGTTLGTAPPASSIPAGTVVQNAAGSRIFVTAQTLSLSPAGGLLPGQITPTAGPWSVPIRHAVDDGSGQSTGAATVTVIRDALQAGVFSATNAQVVSTALTEAQIDAAYTAALAATLDPNTVAHDANISICARQSNSVRRQMRQNAIDASQGGCLGRMAIIRPPLNTAPAVAMSRVAEPGVGAYRDRRTIYCYVGAKTTVPLIQKRGPSGGAGFTADGSVDIGSDGFLASIMSQLPPEENPGQETGFTGAVNGIERGANVQGFSIGTYTQLKAAGICALRMDGGTAIFQSGCTSVDPLANPSLVPISRQRMADFITDSLATFTGSYGKRLATQKRRDGLAAAYKGFLRVLLSPTDAEQQRIGGFTVDKKSANKPELLQQGLYRIRVRVQLLPSLDSIVIESTIGQTVSDVQEVFPQAA